MIKIANRSYKVGDLMRALPAVDNYSPHEPGTLVLITRESGHSRYFYGVVCSTGEESLLSLDNYCGVDDFDSG